MAVVIDADGATPYGPPPAQPASNGSASRDAATSTPRFIHLLREGLSERPRRTHRTLRTAAPMRPRTIVFALLLFALGLVVGRAVPADRAAHRAEQGGGV